jgi:8-oxo-dGTP pyrophosphatase MutT (NUDIX family)
MNQHPSWIFNQSGVIPYRLGNGTLEILLITNRRRSRWVIPKGIVEPGLSPRDSAAQEAWEEAGLTGQVSATSPGSYVYHKWGGTCRVEVFLLRVESIHEDWPEANARTRQWLTVEEAARRVDEEKLKQIILSVPGLLNANPIS